MHKRRALRYRLMLSALTRAGSIGRRLGPEIDLALSIGARRVWQSSVEGRAAARLGTIPDHNVYGSIWRDAAERVGAAVTPLPSGYLEISDGHATTRVWRNLVMLDSPVNLLLASDKPAVHALLQDAGVPVCDYVEVDRGDSASAEEFLEATGGPCVVKPAAGTGRGNGVTCGVGRPDQLARAMLRAARWGPRLLVERQAAGRELRLLFLEGELLDVIERRPPTLLGDGQSRVRDLIAAENEIRLAMQGRAGLFLISADLDCIFALELAGLTLRDVPPAGERVQVKTAVNEGGPEDNRTLTDPLGPELVDEARRAAETVGLQLASVEVVTTDPGTSLEKAGGTVLEVNGSPGLHYHYQTADPSDATAVAVPLLRRLLGQ